MTHTHHTHIIFIHTHTLAHTMVHRQHPSRPPTSRLLFSIATMSGFLIIDASHSDRTTRGDRWAMLCGEGGRGREREEINPRVVCDMLCATCVCGMLCGTAT